MYAYVFFTQFVNNTLNQRHLGFVLEYLLMVWKVSGSKSVQGQKYHNTRVVHSETHFNLLCSTPTRWTKWVPAKVRCCVVD